MADKDYPVMNITEVAALLGPTIKPKTVSQYLAESKPSVGPTGRKGRYADHPFPAPDKRMGKSPTWLRERAAEIIEWRDSRPGQGAGGGRPRQSD